MHRSSLSGTAPSGAPATQVLPAETGPDRRVERRRAVLGLALVSVCFAMLQVVALGSRHAYTDDEAIYLSLLNPLMPPYLWEAHRAVGMALLAGPVAVWDAPIEAVRWYLVVVSTLGLFVAYWPWLRVGDSVAAPVAAGLFGFSYVVLHQAGFVLPNYYTALAAAAATGLFVRYGYGCRSWYTLVGLAVAIGAAGLLRPTDSLWLALPLTAAWLGLRSWRRTGVGLAIGAGLSVGWGFWLVESWAQFSGPAARIREAGRAVGGEARFDLSTVELYARMWSAMRMECFELGGTPCVMTESINPMALLWLMVAAGFGLWGLRARLRKGATAAVAIPLLVGMSLAVAYLFLLRFGAMRFLLPAGAVFAVPVAYGVVSALRASPRWLRPMTAVLATTVVLGQLPLHHTSAEQLADDALGSGSSQQQVVRRIQETSISPPCLTLGDGAFAIGYQLRCEAARLRRADLYRAEEPEPIARARAADKAVAVLLSSPPPGGSYLHSWRRLPAGESGGLLVFLPPGQAHDPSRR